MGVTASTAWKTRGATALADEARAAIRMAVELGENVERRDDFRAQTNALVDQHAFCLANACKEEDRWVLDSFGLPKPDPSGTGLAPMAPDEFATLLKAELQELRLAEGSEVIREIAFEDTRVAVAGLAVARRSEQPELAGLHRAFVDLFADVAAPREMFTALSDCLATANEQGLAAEVAPPVIEALASVVVRITKKRAMFLENVFQLVKSTLGLLADDAGMDAGNDDVFMVPEVQRSVLKLVTAVQPVAEGDDVAVLELIMLALLEWTLLIKPADPESPERASSGAWSQWADCCVSVAGSVLTMIQQTWDAPLGTATRKAQWGCVVYAACALPLGHTLTPPLKLMTAPEQLRRAIPGIVSLLEPGRDLRLRMCGADATNEILKSFNEGETLDLDSSLFTTLGMSASDMALKLAEIGASTQLPEGRPNRSLQAMERLFSVVRDRPYRLSVMRDVLQGTRHPAVVASLITRIKDEIRGLERRDYNLLAPQILRCITERAFRPRSELMQEMPVVIAGVNAVLFATLREGSPEIPPKWLLALRMDVQALRDILRALAAQIERDYQTRAEGIGQGGIPTGAEDPIAQVTARHFNDVLVALNAANQCLDVVPG